jgi:glycosyltransferase involved in cell wall biosynthesis
LLFELAELAYDSHLSRRLSTFCADFAPELLYERYALFGRAGGRAAARLGMPHVLEVNYTCGDPLVRRRSRLLAPLFRRAEAGAFRRATLLAPVSSRLAHRVVRRGVPEQKVLLTPNGVSRRWWREVAETKPLPLPELPAGEPVVGYVGGFYPWHGVARLVEAFRRCREAGLPGSLLLLGDGPERPLIEAQLEEAGLADRALLPGTIAHEELARWIAAMEICVIPCSNDYGSPMKVFEYMGLGRAVLAPDLPPLRDVITDRVTGRLFAAGADEDPVAPLQAGLAELLSDRGLRRAFAVAGRALVGEHHTWQENWRRIEIALGRVESAAPQQPCTHGLP